MGRVEFETIDGRVLGGLGSLVAVCIECDAAQPQDEHSKLDTRVERPAHASLHWGVVGVVGRGGCGGQRARGGL